MKTVAILYCDGTEREYHFAERVKITASYDSGDLFVTPDSSFPSDALMIVARGQYLSARLIPAGSDASGDQ